MFVQEDWVKFRSLGTLTQKAGVTSERLARLVAKELADNALDASGHCTYGIGAKQSFWIQNSGDGIPGTPEEIAALFSIRRPLTSSKLLRLPTRGALGNGLRVVAGAVLSTGGTIHVSTRGRTLRLTPQDDGDTHATVIGEYAGDGTRIEISLPGFDPDLLWVKKALAFAGHGKEYKGKSSPHWYDAESFFELFQAGGPRSVRDIVSELDGCTGRTAGEIAAPFKNRPASSLSREEAEQVLCAARQIAKKVIPERIGNVGETAFVDDGYAGYSRIHLHLEIPSGRGGPSARVPTVLECWVNPHGKGQADFYVNRTPITAEVNSWHKQNEIIIIGAGLSNRFAVGRTVPDVRLNLITPYMPITTDGKAPDFSPIAANIQECITKAIGRAKRWANSVSTDQKLPSQTDIIHTYIAEAAEKASGGGKYRFSIRQLFYGIRPYAIKALGEEPTYDWFSKVIGVYENQHGDIPGMYRDPRGIIYHPHTKEEIPLGTLAIEQYRRPEWTFNKVLYCEKEGFISILRETEWPERNDCALMTAKGFAVRAAKDVIDLLGDDDELTFFCVHDADAYGTTIYQSLQEATDSRPGRRVAVINLGLEPEEAIKMGLPVEDVGPPKKGRRGVAAYVSPYWEEWLQTRRVELNAMTTPQFLEWLDGKMEEYAGKVIPPDEVLSDKMQEEVREIIKKQLTERILEEANFEQQVDDRCEKAQEEIETRLIYLQEEIESDLNEKPSQLWTSPLRRVAGEIVDKAA